MKKVAKRRTSIAAGKCVAGSDGGLERHDFVIEEGLELFATDIFLVHCCRRTISSTMVGMGQSTYSQIRRSLDLKGVQQARLRDRAKGDMSDRLRC